LSLSTGQGLAVADIVRLDQSQAIDWADGATRDWFYANQERFHGAAAAPAFAGGASVVDDSQRTQLLARAIQGQVVGGSRVESQGPYNAVLVRGTKVNHVLHFFLSVFTAGLWAIVWIILAITGGEKRSMITVDDYGNVLVQKV
jgi:hypothetical protein